MEELKPNESVKPRQERFEYPVSLKRAEFDAVLDNPHHTATDVLNLFEPDFGEIFDKDSGVYERYTIRQHTLMVMG